MHIILLTFRYNKFKKRYLKSQNKEIKIILADPFGSSLFNKVVYNVCYTIQQSEKMIKKHRYDTIVEGFFFLFILLYRCLKYNFFLLF
jgi:hypothetical protein